jgi:hypothetical protein
LASFGGEPVPLCLEATGAYRLPLADLLVAQGLHIRVVHPAQIAAFAQSELNRAKTDQVEFMPVILYFFPAAGQSGVCAAMRQRIHLPSLSSNLASPSISP